MKKYFLIAAALTNPSCFAQESKFLEPCKEKIIAYSGGVRPYLFDEHVTRCVTISEYHEKERMKTQRTDEMKNNIREAQLLIQIDDIAKAKGLKDSDLASCGMGVNSQLTIEQLELVVLCMGLKK